MADETQDVGIVSQEPAPAAAETPAPAAAPPADDLESVLASVKQFREETTSSEPAPGQQQDRTDGQRQPPAARPGGNEGQPPAFDQRRIEQIEARFVQDDLSKAIGSVKGAQPALKSLGDGVVKAYLNDQAAADPRIRQAWLQRNADPATFDRVLKGLARKLAADLPSPTDGRTDGERGAAITAARGSSKQPALAAHEARVKSMSDADFEQAWNKRSFG